MMAWRERPAETPACSACQGNVAPGKRCYKCGLEGGAAGVGQGAARPEPHDFTLEIRVQPRIGGVMTFTYCRRCGRGKLYRHKSTPCEPLAAGQLEAALERKLAHLRHVADVPTLGEVLAR